MSIRDTPVKEKSRPLQTLFTRLMALIILVAMGFAGWKLGNFVYANYQDRQDCEQFILLVVNPELEYHNLAALDNIPLNHVSLFKTIPNQIDFSNNIYRNKGVLDRQYCGTVEGSYDLVSQTMKVSIQVNDGQTYDSEHSLLPDEDEDPFSPDEPEIAPERTGYSAAPTTPGADDEDDAESSP